MLTTKQLIKRFNILHFINYPHIPSIPPLSREHFPSLQYKHFSKSGTPSPFLKKSQGMETGSLVGRGVCAKRGHAGF